MRPAVLAPVVVAIVLGILGMHGIDAHGVGLHASMTHAAAPAAAVMAGHEPGAAASSDSHSGGDAALRAVEHPDGHAGGTGGSGGLGEALMLCVAMLAGAAVALLAVLVRRGRLPRVWAVLDPAARLRPVVQTMVQMGTGPPAVWRFSVIRC
jgi:hypothetical protein